MKQFANKTKKTLLTGLFVLIPIFLTVYIMLWMMDIVDALMNVLPTKFHPDTYLPFHVPGLGIIYIVILSLSTGLLVRNYIGKRALHYWEKLVSKIPLVRALYSAIRQVTEAVFSDDASHLKRVVLLEFPRKGIFAIGFVTGKPSRELCPNHHTQMISVFVSTTPNPTSGFYLIVPEDEIINLDIPVEEAFKLILSGGMVNPAQADIEKTTAA
ncbi:MAG: DUF502 domain-containing protein [Pseudomonadota bacterium]